MDDEKLRTEWNSATRNAEVQPMPSPLYKTIETKELENLREYKKIVDSIGSDAVVCLCNALEHARKKHPVFAFRFMNSERERIEANCRAFKENNDQNGKFPSAADILMEEVFEMLEAFGNGQLNQCICEIDDCMAVLVRMRKFVEVLNNSVKTMGV